MFIWTLIFAATILAVSMAFAGIWLAGASKKPTDQEYAIKIYEARLAEIDAEFSSGQIDEEARDAAKAEQARNLIKLAEMDLGSASISRSTAFSLTIVFMILVPLGSGLLYFQLGTPDFAGVDLAAPENASLDELIAAAEKRLLKDPDDVRGWRVLAPVYMRSRQFDKAANAYRNLLRLEGKNSEHLAGLGEAVFMHNNQQITDEAYEAFKELSVLQPKNSQASFFIALGEFQRGDKKAAEEIWQAMLEKSEGNEPWLPAVKKFLSELRGKGNRLDGLSPSQLEQVNQMVAGLASRLAEDPDDKPGWERLVKSYLVLKQNEKAMRAIKKVEALFPADEALHSRLEKMMKDAVTKEAKP